MSLHEKTADTHATARPAAPPPRDPAALDSAVADLQAGLPGWLSLPLEDRITLLRSTRLRLGREAPGVVQAACAAQGVSPDGAWGSEQWMTPLATHLAAFEEVLGRVAAGRDPVPARRIRERPDGQVVVDAVPATRSDGLVYGMWGLRAEVWMQPGVPPEEVGSTAASPYRGSGFDDPGVALVLGAGNFANLPAQDLLHLMLAKGCVVALKLNPVNAYLRPFFERIFADFVDRGWVRFVDEGIESAQYLCRHPGIDRVHMTGSAATFDSLVWGTGEAGIRNRASGTRLLEKPFTAELGAVSPVIVVPGPWSASDIMLQADRIAFTKLMNCGHVCNGTQILVLPEGWEQGDALLEEVRRLMRVLPARAPYYPGTDAKIARVSAGHPDAEALGGPGRRLLITGLDPDSDTALFHEEVFADVLGVVRLPARSVPEYLDSAVAFANDRLAGDLAVSLFLHPDTAKEHATAVDRAVANLRYGAIGVNEWAVWAGTLGYTTWGGFPGNTPETVGSGIGVVGNAYLLADPQKSVVSASFHPRVKPLLAARYRTRPTLMREMMRFETSGDLRALPRILGSVLRA